MPNHIINEIIFDHPASEHAAILAKVCNAKSEVDFNFLVPMPAHVWRGNVGSKHTAAFGEQNIGLDWARLNWGTKWNAYSHAPIEADESRLILRFQTAWAPPYPWLVALFNTCGGFRHNWLDEGRERGVAGKFGADDKGGIFAEEWHEEPADDQLHRHLHTLLWGVEEFEDEEEEEAAE